MNALSQESRVTNPIEMTLQSAVTPETLKAAQSMLIEAVAAQLYTMEQTRPKFWRECGAQTRDHYRKIAQRKLKTGEIHGWPK